MDKESKAEILELAFDCINAGIWSVDMQTRAVWWSDSLYTCLGYQPGSLEASRETFFDVLAHPEDLAHIQSALKAYHTQQVPYHIQCRLKTQSGEYRYFECTGRGVFKDEKIIKLAGTVIDIHERTILSQRLLRTQKSLRQASVLARTGAWELSLPLLKPCWSTEACELFEVDPHGIHSLKQTLVFYASADRRQLLNSIRKAIREGTSWDLELPVITGKGIPRWIRNIGHLVKESGETKLFGAFQDITDRKLVEEKLSVIFENSTDPHLLYDETGIIDCNYATIKMLGYEDKVELIGKQPSDLSPEYQPDGNLTARKKALDSLPFANDVLKFEWLHQRKNGETFSVEVAISRVYLNGKQASLGVWHDLTERNRAQETIRLNQSMLAETQELTHSGSWEIDLLTGENVWSEEAFRIFGLEANRKGPKTEEFNSMVHPEDWPIYEQKVKQAMKGEMPEGADLRIIKKDGTIKYIHAIGKGILGTDGRAIKISGAIMDIDDRKRAETELILAKQQAEQAAMVKSQFLSTMSHEIRTPMNAVIGFTDLLIGMSPSAHQLEYLNILKFSAGHLLVLINDILDFNKIEAGKVEFEEVPFSIVELIDNIKAANKHKAAEKGIALKIMLDQDLPDLVIGDPVRLGQILTNLTSNAVKFTHQGKVSINASLESTADGSVSIHFQVADTGIGIEPEKFETIFESFTQASSDITRKYGGTGLGLTITRRLLELMNSSIQLTSTPGEGTVFSFSLQFRKAKTKAKPKDTAIIKNVRNLKGLVVLIVEDNHINVVLAKQYMKLWEIEADVAVNGLEAVEMVQKREYDVVLMDLQMPEMDGYQATARIRNLKENRFQELPIIALTASVMLEVKDFAFTVGMTDYISKPFNPDDLYSKLAFYGLKDSAA